MKKASKKEILKASNIEKQSLEVSGFEKQLLGEMIKSEKATLKVFPLSNKREQIKYEKILGELSMKFA